MFNFEKMSDSDDNAYSDYLESRRATLQKRRKPVKEYESDSDDDFTPRASSPINKKIRDDDILDDSDEDSLLEIPQTHDEVLKHKIDDVEKEYRRKLFNKIDSVIITKDTNERNDVLKKVKRMCETMDNTVEATKSLEVDQASFDVVESSTCTDSESFPVIVKIVDCETRQSSEIRSTREIPFESTFNDIRREFAVKWNCRPDQVVLTHDGRKAECDDTPKSLGLRPMQIPHPLIEASKEEEEPQNVFTVEDTSHITIKIQLKYHKKPLLLKVTDDMTIHDIKDKVIEYIIEAKEARVPDKESLKIMFDDEFVSNHDATCKEMHFEEADCIDMYY